MDKEIVEKMRQAIKKDDLVTIKRFLLDNEELLNVKTAFGTWLHDAAVYGKYDIANFFIECGLDVNIKGGVGDSGAITSAARKGYYNIVKLMYVSGAELDVSNMARNPLFAAIYNGHSDVVKFLVENGIDITAHYSIGELERVDAYEYARQYGQTEIANYLKEKLNELDEIKG